MRKKILIAAGGTGGHIFPAEGFAEQLTKISPETEILFAAGGLSTNRYFDRTKFPYKEVSCSPILSKHPVKLAKGLYNLVKGTKEAVQIIKDFQPDIVVAFGSFYTIPILLGAKLQQVPYILHEANSIPGKANKWLSAYAQAVGIHFPMTRNLLKGNIYEVGMPLRTGFQANVTKRSEALSYYHLKESLPTLLIFGGSQGAQGINQLMKECTLGKVQIIHLTGKEDEVEFFKSFYHAKQIPASVKPFENKMQMAWSAADLFIGRSGASTIAEALEFEIPGILIPYPHATDNHQDKNADFLVKTVGSAIKYQENQLSGQQLSEAIHQVSTNIDIMKTNAKNYKLRPDKMDLCQLVMQELGVL